MLHRPLLLMLAAAMALVLAACGGGGGTQSGDDGSDHAAGDHQEEERVYDPIEGAESVTLTAIDIDYKPARLSLIAGEPTNVTVVNEGETAHDFTLDEAEVHMNIEPGSEAETSVTVDEPGDYRAFCSVPGHEDAGMFVEVSVTE